MCSHLTYETFKNVLFAFQIYGDFLVIFLLFDSSVNHGQKERILCVILILLNLWKVFFSAYNILDLGECRLCFEENAYSAAVE